MNNLERVLELIEQTSTIKNYFSTLNIPARSPKLGREGGEYHFTTFKTIKNEPEFIDWKADLEYELSKLKQDQLVVDILELFNQFNGWSDQQSFIQLESKLKVLKEHLLDYKEVKIDNLEIDDIRIPERELNEKLLGALCKLQKNSHYSASDKEDTLNDFIRDMLSNNYEVKDQTRQGESTNGNDAGEIDIQICDSGLPIVMIEGLKLDSLKVNEVEKHVNKVLTKYDPNGCPYAVLIIYSVKCEFNSFYERLFKYLNEYNYPYQKKSDLMSMNTVYSEIKHAQIVLERNGQDTLVHYYVVHMS